ncbi:unnamed protein product [Ilex paraguariensis]|uniref:WRKY domain-containing protein n=1 Tax=Ilex paraguariensis TaxID=185542 RepID=A0ABC8UQH0_9AQUA
MDENQRSFEALEVENPKPIEEQHEDENDDEEYDEDGDEQRQASELESSIGAKVRDSQSETLAVASSVQLPESDLQAEFGATSHLLSEVPVEYTLQPLDSTKFKDQVEGLVTHQEALINVTEQAAQTCIQNQLQSNEFHTSLDLSPTSNTKSTLSVQNSTPRRLSTVANGNSICISEVDMQSSSDSKSVSAAPIVKTHSPDGYNWRKYGQKQVKSPQGSRSYYRCTNSECFAKKIECCDHSNHVIEIIYKSQHSHDPPRKINSPRESRLSLPVVPVLGNNNTAQPIRALSDSDPSTSSKEPVQEMLPTHETKQEESRVFDGDAEINVEEHVDEPEPKRRMKKSSSVDSGLTKPGKKPKFVVHAAGDVGISGDGYRWRKYGQKMVKGNPHPRNYYRCTSAGCPVRKHIESATDSTTAVIITYKGVHDHDMPVPKKRHGLPSAPLVAAAAPASMNNLQFKKTESLENQISATKWSVGTEGELTGEALDIGGERTMESARTLLSIGFEIKPC